MNRLTLLPGIGRKCIVLFRPDWAAVFRHFSTRSGSKTYYEVLGLDKNCGQTDIKNAFLRLSMELHPDKQPASSAGEQHFKFVELSNAYNILYKHDTRALYDASLKENARRRYVDDFYGVETDCPRERVIFRDPYMWENRDKSQDAYYESRPYYGVSWIKHKLPNSYIVCGILVFMLIGNVGSYYLAQFLQNSSLRKSLELDRRISASYLDVRRRALTQAELQVQFDELKAELEKQVHQQKHTTDPGLELEKNKKILEKFIHLKNSS